jgi:hypothetical protein
VIIILTTIVAAAIPLMAPADENRRLREATRGLTAFCAGAQTRAVALNRPFGIGLKRLSQDTGRVDDRGACLELFYVEQAPPYAGFEANSRACVALHPTSNLKQLGLCLIRFVTRGTPPANSKLPPGWVADLWPENTIRPGDVIEVGGTRFLMILPMINNDPFTTLYVNTNNNDKPNSNEGDAGFYRYRFGNTPPTALVRPINDSGQQLNPRYDHQGFEIGTNDKAAKPYWTSPAPYKIFRQPSPSSEDPYQLPEGTAIDLRASGVGSDDYFYVPNMNDNSDPVTIMFAPEGRVSRVTFSQLPINQRPPESPEFDEPVAENVFLLVGQRAKIPAPPTGNDPTLDSAATDAAATDQQRQELRRPINWLSGDSRWVVIGAQSGRIATIRNALVDLGVVTTMGSPSEMLRTEQIRKAREFTRDMIQEEGR